MNRVLAMLTVVFVGGLASHTPAADLDPTFAYEIFQVAQDWVRRGDVPETALTLEVNGVTAVHATLRRQGATVGQATVMAQPLVIAPDQAVDVMRLTRQAVRQALDEALFNSPPPPSQTETARPDLPYTLDLQFAHGLRTVRLEKLADLLKHVTPGVHGLAMQSEGREVWLFPGNALAGNLNLNAQLNRMLAQLKVPNDKKASLGTQEGPTLMAFDVVHLTAIGSDTRATRLYRGHDVLPASPLDQQDIELLSAQLADYLIHRQRADGTFAGTYEPTADQYRPVTADVTESALAVYALWQSARLSDASAESRRQAARKGLQALLTLIGRNEVERRVSHQVLGFDIAPTAMTLLALCASPENQLHKDVRDSLVSSLLASQDDNGWFRLETSRDSEPASASLQSLGLAALVAAYEQTRDATSWVAIRKARDALWEKQPELREPAELLPWAAIAETRLSKHSNPNKARQQINALYKSLWARQIRVSASMDVKEFQPDTLGGFKVGYGLSDEPSWLTCQVLHGLVVALGDKDQVGDESRGDWLVNAAWGMRFVLQLSFQTPSTYYTRSPGEALGGMRLALGDNRQPLSATASALLATTELLYAIQELSK